MRWTYDFFDATSDLGHDPSLIAPGGFAQLWGVDGRCADVLRRYPGHIRYMNSTGETNLLTSSTAFSINHAQYFEIQKHPNTTDRIRGFLVHNQTTGELELWYRYSTDTTGDMRKLAITDYATNNLVAQYDASGDDFEPMSGGLGLDSLVQHEITCCTTWDDGNGTALYVGGRFRYAGGRNIFCIAKWDGHKWSRLTEGIGPNGYIYAMTVYNSKLVIGGAFTLIDSDVTANYIAQWDGKTWTTLGTGFNAAVYSLLAHSNGTDLYIGGNFTLASGVSMLRAARWTGSAYANLGGTVGDGLNGIPYAITESSVSGTALVYFGGAFTTFVDSGAAAAPGVRLVSYNPATNNWAIAYASTGAAGTVYGLQVNGSVLYACGAFTGIDGNTRNLVAQTVDGLAWTAMQTGLTNTAQANAMTVHGGSLYVGGTFTQALTGTISVPGIAKWSGTAFSAPGANGTLASGGGGGTFSINALCSGTLIGGSSRMFVGGRGFKTAASAFSGCTVSLCSRGRFLYLLSSNGYHLTLYWDPATSVFLVRPFGPGQLRLSPPAGSVTPSASDLGIAGNYQAAYRYYDPLRLRLTGLSDHTTDALLTAADYYTATNSGAGLPLWGADATFSKARIYSTISSGSTDAGGGTFYLAKTGSLNLTDGSFSAQRLRATATDDGAGTFADNLSDAALERQTSFDEFDDEVMDLGPCYAAAFYQGLTVALEEDGTFLSLRWSPLTPLEPENFPSTNTFRTLIKTSDLNTCQLIVAGDYCYCFGSNRVYRLERKGNALGIVELHQGWPFIHRDAFARVGNLIYAATELGIVVIDARSGSLQLIEPTRRLFLDRWRSTRTANSTSSGLRVAYDGQMGCVYFLNYVTKECLCLWQTTGKITLLSDMNFEAVVSGPDLDLETVERAYFLSKYRYFVSPNYKYDQAYSFTVHGVTLYSGGTKKYNMTLTGSSFGSSSTTLTTGTSSNHPFTADGVNASVLAGMRVTFLSGTLAGQSYSVISNTASTLTLDTAHGNLTASIASGDAIAISPVNMAIVGGPLWAANKALDLTHRRVVSHMQAVPCRVSSSTTLGQTAPLSTAYGLMTFGVIRPDELTQDEPLTGTITPLVRLITYQEGPITLSTTGAQSPGASWNTENPSKNVVKVSADGNRLFPVWWSRVSNLMMDLQCVSVDGEYRGQEEAGSST